LSLKSQDKKTFDVIEQFQYIVKRKNNPVRNGTSNGCQIDVKLTSIVFLSFFWMFCYFCIVI